MASDYRMMQHHAAVATHGLTSAVEYLRSLFRQHPEIVAAEYADVFRARNELEDLIDKIDQRKWPAA